MIASRIRVAVLGIVVSCASACRHKPDEPPVVPDDMAWDTTTTEDPLQWRAAGFIELTTPVRPPTTEDGTAHIVVVIKLPPAARLRLTTTSPLSFELPVGTVAARVEYAGAPDAPDAEVESSWRVLDVRQFEWTSAGIDCAVLRPDGGGRMVGLRWRCGIAADARAGEVLAGFAREHRFAGPRSDDARQRQANRLRLVNDCRGCHAFGRPEDRRTSALVQRRTDMAGLFSLGAVFRDEDPVERYRPVDTNAGDPMMTPVCRGSEIDVAAARCADGLRPRLFVEIARGVREGSRHVQQLCETRRSLAAVVDPASRSVVEEAMAVCAPP